MNASVLERVGLTPRKADGVLHADLELTSSLLNPLARRFIDKVSFVVNGERLEVVAPHELVGMHPFTLANIEKASQLEQLIQVAFSEQMSCLQKRSADLQALGLSPRVDPETLGLGAEVAAGDRVFALMADRQGNFSVVYARFKGELQALPQPTTFELSEFREQGALLGYLEALVGDKSDRQLPASRESVSDPERLTFAQVAEAFGPAARIPPTSGLEVLVQLRARGELYRFAAVRVSGQTFRGLLAGAHGKLWAERFDLDQFPGVPALMAHVLGIPEGDVEVKG